jgi:biopolymer transport protein ExbD
MKRIITILLIVFSLSSCQYILPLMGISMASKPEPMELNLPENIEKGQVAPTDKSFTILLLGNEKFYAYIGKNPGALLTVNSGQPFIRTIVKDANKKFGKNFIIILKPSTSSSYKDIVDALDEMTINNVKRYGLSEMNTEEKLLLEKLKRD